MTAAEKLELVSVDDYLAGELNSTIKHEYLGGMVYAMAGARNAHNVIATNVVGVLHARLRGKKCRPQFRHENSRPSADTLTVLLSRRLGGLPAESARRFVPGRASRHH